MVRAAMAQRGYSFKSLAATLENTGYPITEKALALRVNRGTFNLGFALRMLRVMGVARVDIEHIDPYLGTRKKASSR